MYNLNIIEVSEWSKGTLPVLFRIHNTYTYDNVGNRTSMTDVSGTKNYTYDPTYQLLQVTTPTTNAKGNPIEKKLETYTYDPVGNRLTGHKPATTYTYNQNNQITNIQSQNSNQTQFQYDANGNRSTKTETKPDGTTTITYYTYDYDNRLIKVEIRKGNLQKEVTYTYDPFGRRISKTIHKEEIDADGEETDLTLPRTTYYLYDNEDIILAYNQKGRITASYTHGHGIDEPISFINKQGEIYFYHADALGSIIALTDTTGNIVQTYEYDSFGNLKKQGDIKQPYTYTGREHDQETGLYFYRARYYDPKIGRFISEDPIGLRGGINLYVYTFNNPVNFIDPFGLSACEDNCKDFRKKCYLLAGIGGATAGVTCRAICIAITKAPLLCTTICAGSGSYIARRLETYCYQTYLKCMDDCKEKNCEDSNK